MTDRARHESMVRLGVRRPMTSRGALAILACWLLLVFGVLVIPIICVFFFLVTAGPLESGGPPPPASSGAMTWFWTARTVATASAVGILAVSVTVTARRGRLVNGWVALVLCLPVLFLLWDVSPG